MSASTPAANLAAEMFAADRASRELGMDLVELGEGSAVVRMTIGRQMVNGHGIAHGGFAAACTTSPSAAATR